MSQQPEAERDYYSILDAADNATPAEIERCYKRLAVRHHPDRGGDEEEMKTLNEAYRVLGNEAARRAYDESRESQPPPMNMWAPPPRSSSPAAQADAFSGRIVFAVLCLFAGLALLFLVRFQYIWFLWPLGILAVFVVFMGVWMAHAALAYAREGFAPSHPARRYVWAQETVFWSIVAGGIYGVYLVMSAI